MPTIRQRASGRWQVIVKRKDHQTASKTFRKKAVAEAWARKILDEMEQGVKRPTLMTVEEALNKYEKKFTPQKRSASRERSRFRILRAGFGHFSLSGLTPNNIVEYVEGREVSSDTIRKELNTLSVVIDAAIALWEAEIVNPVNTAKSILKVTKTLSPGVKRNRRPTKAELKKLYKSEYGNLWEFFVETAMRRGEVANMKRKDRKGKTLSIPKTKTDEPRTIPLSKRALEILNDLSSQINGSIWAMHPDTMTHEFIKACRADKIKDLRLHDLRHEGTSRLFEKELSIPEVAVITGHADWSSLKRYTKLCPKKIGKKLG